MRSHRTLMMEPLRGQCIGRGIVDGLHDVRPFRLGLAVRRHVLLIVTVTVGVAVVVGAFTLRQSHGYTATSRVVLKPLVGAGLGPGDVASSTQINVAMQTEAGIVS